jgi:predicted DNA-binding transcriptional regulator YafY
VAAFVSRSVASHPYPFRARVLFHAPVARVAERVPPLTGYLQRVDDERCRLEWGARSLDVLAAYLTLVDEEFEVEEPPELLDTLRRLAARLRRATARARDTHR